MVTCFKTVSGSIYQYDDITLRWTRIAKAEKSGFIRIEDTGVCLHQPPGIAVGNGVVFAMAPIVANAIGRWVITATVKEILWRSDGNDMREGREAAIWEPIRGEESAEAAS